MNGAPQAAEARLALDARSLDALKRASRERPDEALKAAAKQFEAVFMNMLMKSMRDAVPKLDPLAGEQSRLYTSMLDQQLAQRLGERGVGIADMVLRQLAPRHAESGGEAAPSAPMRALQKLSTLTREASGTGTAPAAQSFVDRLLPQAKVAEQASGVPAEFILGQAALESGWGRHEIRGVDGANSHNLFGIKAGGGWKGATVDVLTTEYSNGAPRKVVEKFRAYGSYAEAFQDWARLIGGSPRYAQALDHQGDPARFASRIQQAGYATDPRYAEKLTRVINHTIALSRSA